MAEHIKALILTNSPPNEYEFDLNTELINSEHIVSAVHLPEGHEVRKILAATSVKGYLKKDKYKFEKETKEILGFSSNLLKEVKNALKTLKKVGMKSRL
jgi:predicted Zn-dependent protease